MPVPSRRSVLQGAAVVTASVALPATVCEPAFAAIVRRPLRRSTFRPLVGQGFTLTAGGKSCSAKLVEIGDFNAATAASDRAFTLLFRGKVPAEGICRVSHPKSGAFSLFLAPVSARSGVAQAVISA